MLVSFSTSRNATIYGSVVEEYTDDEDGDRYVAVQTREGVIYHVQEARIHQFQPGDRVSFRWARMTIYGTVITENAGDVLVRGYGGKEWKVTRDRLVRLHDAVPSGRYCASSAV